MIVLHGFTVRLCTHKEAASSTETIVASADVWLETGLEWKSKKIAIICLRPDALMQYRSWRLMVPRVMTEVFEW